ncbi:MAG: hypothetical protein H6685_06590 [Deltaproteobacteria bacterium]|nr:hypothetical protein [Deltaproteobacteria bacterium]
MEAYKLTLRFLIIACLVFVSYSLMKDDEADPGLDSVKAWLADLFAEEKELGDKPMDLEKSYKILVVVPQPTYAVWGRYIRPMEAAADQTIWMVDEDMPGEFSIVYDEKKVTIIDALEMLKYLDINKSKAHICTKTEQKNDYGVPIFDAKCKSTPKGFHNIHVEEAEMIVTLGNVDVPFIDGLYDNET